MKILKEDDLISMEIAKVSYDMGKTTIAIDGGKLSEEAFGTDTLLRLSNHVIVEGVLNAPRLTMCMVGEKISFTDSVKIKALKGVGYEVDFASVAKINTLDADIVKIGTRLKSNKVSARWIDGKKIIADTLLVNTIHIMYLEVDEIDSRYIFVKELLVNRVVQKNGCITIQESQYTPHDDKIRMKGLEILTIHHDNHRYTFAGGKIFTTNNFIPSNIEALFSVYKEQLNS